MWLHAAILKKEDSAAALKLQSERENTLLLLASPHRRVGKSMAADAQLHSPDCGPFQGIFAGNHDLILWLYLWMHRHECIPCSGTTIACICFNYSHLFPSHIHFVLECDSNLPYSLGVMGDVYKPLCEEASSVAHFLQVVISGTRHLTEAAMAILIENCAASLALPAVRSSLVATLRNAIRLSQERNISPQQRLSALGGARPGMAEMAAAGVCQVHKVAFEALVNLFVIVLQQCSEQKDFLTAFSLLQVIPK